MNGDKIHPGGNIYTLITNKMHTVNYPKLFRYLVFAFAAVYLVEYLYLVVSRIGYPYELEWIEGGMLQVVQRVVNGQHIYVSPGIEYVPFLYPPAYFYLSAGFALIFGDGFFPLRLVSVLASIVSFATIFCIVREETGDGWTAFFSMGLFAASYRVTGAWLDIARVDSLFLAFTLLAIYFARGKASFWKTTVCGIFSVLAILSKQTAFIICIPIFIGLLFRNWKQGAAYLGIVGTTLVAFILIVNQKTDGWYTFFVYGLLSQQTQWLPLEFINFWKADLIIHLPISLILSAFFLVEKYKQERVGFLSWFLVLTGMVGSSFLSRVKIGGYENVLLPMFAIFCILSGMGLHRLYKALVQSKSWRSGTSLLYMACLFQFAILAYNPFAQIPTKEDLREGNQFVAYLSSLEGKIYLPDHGYLLSLAGKEEYAHHSAIWDVMRTDQDNKGKDILTPILDGFIQNQFFDVIIMDEEGNFCCRDIETYYINTGEVFTNPSTFYPVTGDGRRPTYIHVSQSFAINR